MSRLAFAALAIVLMADPAAAQTVDLGALIPSGGASASGRIIEMVALLTVLSVAPGLLIMVTSFTRFIIALSFLRTGLGAPANLVLISLALFMTFFVMAPTFDRAWQTGLKPMLDNQISQQDALAAVAQPFREFMLSQVREKDIALFESLSKGRFEPGDRSKVDFRLLIPAYMISEHEARLRNRFPCGAPVPRHRHDRGHAHDVDGHDDAAALDHFAAGQSPVLRARRRLEPACRQPRPLDDLRRQLQARPWGSNRLARRGVFMTILNTSVSGMSADSNWLSSISQNVANANTTGYKNVETDFSTMVDQVASGSVEGAGVQTSTISLNSLQGSIVTSQTATNLAVQGAGFFVVSDSAGDLYLTRNGSFVPDASGNLVNSAGYYLMANSVQNGQSATPANSLSGLQKVNVDNAGQTATPTTSGSLTANLPSTSTTIASADLPSANSSNSTYTDETSLVVYDNLGGAHTINLYFANEGNGTWEVDAFDASKAASAGGFPYSSGPLATQTLTFGSTGALKSGRRSPSRFLAASR